jgi:hypothetical protein
MMEVIACPGPLSGRLGNHQDRVDHAMNAEISARMSMPVLDIKENAATRAMMEFMLRL